MKLTSFTPNTYGKDTYLRDTSLFKRLESIEHTGTVIETHSQLELLLFPKGMEASTKIGAFNKGHCVGIIGLRKIPHIPEVAFCGVLPPYVGKGVGTMLYEAALRKFGALRSSSYLSVGSSRSWARLCQRYNGKLVMNGRKLSIIRFVAGTDGITYPLLKTGSLETLLMDENKKVQKLAHDSYYEITI